MQGRRRPEGTKPWDLEAGDYCLSEGAVWVRLPSGVGPSRLPVATPTTTGATWEMVEHEDGTITLAPSILDSGTPNGWHGYLERGVWRSV